VISRFVTLACAVLLLLGSACRANAAEPGSAFLLRPGKVWTGDEAPAHPGWAVLVRDGVIVAVGEERTLAVPTDARRIDLPGTTLTPGLIDLHSHLFLHPYNEVAWNDQVLKEPEAYRTVLATQHARDTLMAGFTTLRDLGTEGAGYADVSIKRAIDEGLIPGPRLFIATRAIVASSSYGPGPRGFRPDIELPQGAQEVSGRAEATRAVREQAGRGADWNQALCRLPHRQRWQRATDVHCRRTEGDRGGRAPVGTPRGRARRQRQGHAHGDRSRRRHRRARLCGQ